MSELSEALKACPELRAVRDAWRRRARVLARLGVLKERVRKLESHVEKLNAEVEAKSAAVPEQYKEFLP